AQGGEVGLLFRCQFVRCFIGQEVEVGAVEFEFFRVGAFVDFVELFCVHVGFSGAVHAAEADELDRKSSCREMADAMECAEAAHGIRSFHVTGVQTCALPILLRVVKWVCCSGVSSSGVLSARRLRSARSSLSSSGLVLSLIS